MNLNLEEQLLIKIWQRLYNAIPDWRSSVGLGVCRDERLADGCKRRLQNTKPTANIRGGEQGRALFSERWPPG